MTFITSVMTIINNYDFEIFFKHKTVIGDWI